MRREMCARVACLFLSGAAFFPAQVASAVKPPALEKGDTIGIVAPASSLDEALVERAVENLRSRGYRVKLALGYRERRGYLASTDGVRAGELNAFFSDPEVKMILCLRGGYGSPRLLDRVDYGLIREHPKILVGYSDITALLNAIHRKTGLVVFHGPMAKEFALGDGLTPYSERYFWPAFRSESPQFADWGGGGPTGRDALRALVPGEAEGILVGGNLSVLAATMGTPYEVPAAGAILFLEEVQEKPFRIDRMLNQLRLSGKLERYEGFLLGSFTGCDERGSETELGLDDVISDYFLGLGVPVLAGYPAGHQPDQATLPIGLRVRLDATARKLVFLEPPVAAGRDGGPRPRAETEGRDRGPRPRAETEAEDRGLRPRLRTEAEDRGPRPRAETETEG